LVFLTGLVPAAVAFAIRMKVKEPQVWKPCAESGVVRELFSPALRRRTIGGLSMAIIALLGWWSCFAFLPLLGQRLAAIAGGSPGTYVATGTNCYSFGGLLGTLLTFPIAVTLGRRWMFALYFAFSAAAVYLAFGGPFEPMQRMHLMFPVGIGVF